MDLIYIAVLSTCLTPIFPVPVQDFYSFGESIGDSLLPENDDGFTEPILISSLYPFFNHQHDRLIVNNNGVISFLGQVSQYTPDAFPLGDNRRLIAPFWGDVDTRGDCGKVWYRGTVHPDELFLTTLDVQNHGPINMHRFRATWAFIATWEDVCFFGASDVAKTKTNTFQAVLTTNGRHSFVIFNYAKIDWTTGTASGGDANTGLGGTPAQVGFNAGDGVVYYSVNGSRTPDILNLPDKSNIGVPGKFLFQIDKEEIQSSGCNTEGTLTITPRFGSMLGGHYIRVAGPCFNLRPGGNQIRPHVADIKFDSQPGTARCYAVDDFTAECVVPTTLFKTGHLKVDLFRTDSEAGQIGEFTGFYSPENIIKHQPHIKRVNAEEWKFGAPRLELSWDPEQVTTQLKCGTSDVGRLDLIIYRESKYAGPEWAVYAIHPNTLRISTGSYAIEFTDSKWLSIRDPSADTEGSGSGESESVPSGLLGTDRAGIFRIACDYEKITLEEVRTKSAVWSDVHDLNYLRYTRPDDVHDYCDSWRANEFISDPIDNVTPCPCTLDQALIDLGRFHPDPRCYQGSSSPSNCAEYPDAIHCVHSNILEETDHGQRCCYYSPKKGQAGELIRDNPDPVRQQGESYVRLSGRCSRYHYQSASKDRAYGKIPYLSNFLGDEIPYRDCRKYNNDTTYQKQQCENYARLRPASDCTGYEPPIPAGGIGDPHILTMDGFRYTFNGIGEYVMLYTANKSFTLQARTEQAKNMNGVLQQASVFTAVVARVNSSDTVQVQLNDITTTEVFVNGETQDFDDNPAQNFNDMTDDGVKRPNFDLGVDIVSQNNTKVTLVFSQARIAVIIDAAKDIMNIMVVGPPTMKGNTRGLLGVWNDDPDDDLTMPNGTTLSPNSSSSLLHEFGLSWTIAENTSLFKYPTGKTFSSYQHPEFVPSFPEDVLQSVTNEQREQCGNRVECIFDLVTTNSPEIAQMTSNSISVVEETAQALQPVIRCPSDTIVNGYVNTSGYKVNDIAFYHCTYGHMLVGPQLRICQSDGTWENKSSTCQRVVCPELMVPNGSVEYDNRHVGDIANFSCFYGYILIGPSSRTCLVSGVWNDSMPVCSAIACPIASLINGDILSGGHHLNDVIHFKCHPGYQFIGQNESICLANGSWSASQQLCLVIRCPSDTIVNGYVNASGYKVNDIASYHCTYGHILVGPQHRICQSDGTWENKSSTCQRVVCPELMVPNGSVEYANRHVDDIANFSCSYGYILIGPSSRTCLVSGVWSDSMPVCNAIACPIMSLINGDILSDGHHLNDVIHFKCHPGYQLIGQSESICLANGSWSASQQRCSGDGQRDGQPVDELVLGLSVGACVFALLIVALTLFACRRRRHAYDVEKDKRMSLHTYHAAHDNPIYTDDEIGE